MTGLQAAQPPVAVPASAQLPVATQVAASSASCFCFADNGSNRGGNFDASSGHRDDASSHWLVIIISKEAC